MHVQRLRRCAVASFWYMFGGHRHCQYGCTVKVAETVTVKMAGTVTVTVSVTVTATVTGNSNSNNNVTPLVTSNRQSNSTRTSTSTSNSIRIRVQQECLYLGEVDLRRMNSDSNAARTICKPSQAGRAHARAHFSASNSTHLRAHVRLIMLLTVLRWHE